MIRLLQGFVAFLAVSFAPATFAVDSAPAGADSGRSAKAMHVVVQISDGDPALWNLTLNNVRNVQSEVGANNIEIELVALGPGLAMLKDDSLVANRVQEAMATGAHFVACRNTMRAQHVTDAEMIPGIGYVQAGVVEIIRKQMEGYSYLRP